MDKKATARQIKAIKAAQRHLGMEEHTYRAMVGRFSGGRASSCKDLSIDEATRLLNHLAGSGAERLHLQAPAASSPGIVSGGKVVAIATPAQRAEIGRLRGQVAWRSEEGYVAWLAERMKLEQVRTKEQAAKVIEGLKGMIRHGHSKPG